MAEANQRTLALKEVINKPKNLSAEEGVVYLSSSSAGAYTVSKVTADMMKKYSENVYGAGIALKHKNLIFQEKFIIRVLDEKGEPDEEAGLELTKMCDEIGLWSHMQTAWMDVFWFGMSFFNPVWKNVGGVRKITKLRHLPAESFGTASYQRAAVYSKILPGVTLNPDNPEEVEYWQTLTPNDIVVPKVPAGTTTGYSFSNNQYQTKLSNIFTLKDPSFPDLAGSPKFLPVAPLLAMLDFCWTAQMQKVNRIGAPILFMRITDSKGDDIEVGQSILQNWGKNTPYQIRENMEIIMPNLQDSSSAMETINTLAYMILEYFTPSGLIGDPNVTSAIGGSDASQLDLLMSYVAGEHEWISEGFQTLLKPFLEGNSFPEGYRIEIEIPQPSINKAELWLEQAKFGMDYGLIDRNAGRNLIEQEELDDAGLKKLEEDTKARQEAMKPPAPPTPEPNAAEKVSAMADAIAATPLDSEAVLTKQQAKKFIQKQLGMEE